MIFEDFQFVQGHVQNVDLCNMIMNIGDSNLIVADFLQNKISYVYRPTQACRYERNSIDFFAKELYTCTLTASSPNAPEYAQLHIEFKTYS